jgi:chloride channel protein, CIC family
MVTEMTGSLALVAPAMVAVVISYFLVGPKYTIYHNQVPSRADSPAHRGEYNIPVMTTIKVSEAMETDLLSLPATDNADKAFALMTENKIRGIPIIAQDKQVLGVVSMNDILKIPSDHLRTTKLEDIMTKNVITVFPESTLFDALDKFTTAGVGRLPVIDHQSKQLVGILTMTDLYSAYRKRIQT